MKITFIRHSCYTVETDNYFLIFDYIGGKLQLPENKISIFFVSHRHSDHFKKEIFNFNADHYIISDDVDIKKAENITPVSPDNELDLLGIKVKTHGSTDEGVSFYVNVDGTGIVHCGDLNYWIWPEYSKSDIENMDRWFKSEADKFKNENVFAIMLPVDPRLKDNYYLTCDYFLRTNSAKHYFPMHMWENYSISQKLKNKYKNIYPQKIIHVIQKENQIFEFQIKKEW